VSGPGKLSQRTDLTPQGRTQPVRSFPAQYQGQRQELKNLQQAAPLETAGGATAGGAAPAPSPTSPAAPAISAFRPTERPAEPITAGTPLGAGPGPMQTQAGLDYWQMLQVMHNISPNPQIARLLATPQGRFIAQ